MVYEILRRPNRTLYAKAAGGPITLSQIAAWVSAGDDVRIYACVKRKKGPDITAEVLRRVLAESPQQELLTAEVLHRMLRSQPQAAELRVIACAIDSASSGTPQPPSVQR